MISTPSRRTSCRTDSAPRIDSAGAGTTGSARLARPPTAAPTAAGSADTRQPRPGAGFRNPEPKHQIPNPNRAFGDLVLGFWVLGFEPPAPRPITTRWHPGCSQDGVTTPGGREPARSLRTALSET